MVEDLAREIPSLKTFVTLSPVPGFSAWLDRERRSDSPQGLTRDDIEALRAIDEPGWHADKARADAVKKALIPAAAAYFLRAKNERGKPLDPVARFHLGNGARLERLNFLGGRFAQGAEPVARADGQITSTISQPSRRTTKPMPISARWRHRAP